MPHGRSRRALLFAVPLVVAALAAAPSIASAQCPDGAQCATVTVPLNHADPSAGTLPLAYAKVPAKTTRTGTIVLLSGGPGQAAIPLTKSITELLDDARDSYDIVTVDQRGTGDSGAVKCATNAGSARTRSATGGRSTIRPRPRATSRTCASR